MRADADLPQRLSWVGLSVLREKPIFGRLVDYFSAVRVLLEEVSIDGILREYFDDEDALAYLRSSITGDVHFGCLVPDQTPHDLLVAAANHVGFSFNQRSFPSTIVAEELATLGGRPVPTTIFEASLSAATTSYRRMEAFLPHADPLTVDAWIRDGVAAHIGLRVKELSVLPRALELCKTHGLHLPSFLHDGLGKNILEGVTAFYIDRPRCRLEFYHREP